MYLMKMQCDSLYPVRLEVGHVHACDRRMDTGILSVLCTVGKRCSAAICIDIPLELTHLFQVYTVLDFNAHFVSFLLCFVL